MKILEFQAFKKLFELGEANAKPFEWHLVFYNTGGNGHAVYQSENDMIIVFELFTKNKTERIFGEDINLGDYNLAVSFMTLEDYKLAMNNKLPEYKNTNTGDHYRLFATVIETLKDLLNRLSHPVDNILLGAFDDKRLTAYRIYAKNIGEKLGFVIDREMNLKSEIDKNPKPVIILKRIEKTNDI